MSPIVIGFFGGGICTAGVLLATRLLRGRSNMPDSTVTDDQAELIRLRARDEGRESGRTEARATLEKELKLAADLAAATAYQEGYTRGRQEALESYRVDIVPFFRKRKIGFAGFKKFQYDYGYNYQLFVNDMPCLEPTERVIKTETESDIDAEQLKNNVQALVESVVAAAKDGLVGGIKVGKAIEKKAPE